MSEKPHRRAHEATMRTDAVRGDTGVSVRSRCLEGRTVILAVSGGIAAVESVRLGRELRRHGASVFAMMTRGAEKVISSLALSWGSGSEVLTEWEPEMSQLGRFDGLLLAPATRNTIAKHVHGIIDSPVMMALSAAKGNGTPSMFVPSMHDDLFHDGVTEELLVSLESTGSHILVSQSTEGRRKQPDPRTIVSNFCNIINRHLPNRRRVAVTLGANRAPIDAIRSIQNTSTGRSGWHISEHLFRMGHEVICIAGDTSAHPSFQLPDVRTDPSPNGMLSLCTDLATSPNPPEAWIHSAAVLDFIPEGNHDGKKASGDEAWDLRLLPGPKHISELSHLVSGCTRVGFKLEVSESENALIDSAMTQITQYGLDAVVANLLSEVKAGRRPRCRLVRPNGDVSPLQDELEMCEAIEALIAEN